MIVQPNIVCDYKIGNTHIKIADNFCRDRTPEDVEKILWSVAKKAQRSLSAEVAINGDEYITTENRFQREERKIYDDERVAVQVAAEAW